MQVRIASTIRCTLSPLRRASGWVSASVLVSGAISPYPCVDETSNTGARVYLSRPAVPAAKRCYSVAAGAGAAGGCGGFSQSPPAPHKGAGKNLPGYPFGGVVGAPAPLAVRERLREGGGLFL